MKRPCSNGSVLPLGSEMAFGGQDHDAESAALEQLVDRFRHGHVVVTRPHPDGQQGAVRVVAGTGEHLDQRRDDAVLSLFVTGQGTAEPELDAVQACLTTHCQLLGDLRCIDLINHIIFYT